MDQCKESARLGKESDLCFFSASGSAWTQRFARTAWAHCRTGGYQPGHNGHRPCCPSCPPPGMSWPCSPYELWWGFPSCPVLRPDAPRGCISLPSVPARTYLCLLQGSLPIEQHLLKVRTRAQRCTGRCCQRVFSQWVLSCLPPNRQQQVEPAGSLLVGEGPSKHLC